MWQCTTMGHRTLTTRPAASPCVLELRAFKQLVDRFLASASRLLVTAARNADVMRARAIDPDVARFHARCQAVRRVEFVRPDGGG